MTRSGVGSYGEIAGPESTGEQLMHCELLNGVGVTDADDFGFRSKLVQDLAACSAGCCVGVRRCVQHYSLDPTTVTFRNCLAYGSTFGADGKPIARVLDVAAGEDGAILGQDGSSNGELAIWCVRT